MRILNPFLFAWAIENEASTNPSLIFWDEIFSLVLVLDWPEDATQMYEIGW